MIQQILGKVNVKMSKVIQDLTIDDLKIMTDNFLRRLKEK